MGAGAGRLYLHPLALQEVRRHGGDDGKARRQRQQFPYIGAGG